MTIQILSEGNISTVENVLAIEIKEETVGLRFDADTVLSVNLNELKVPLVIAILDK